MSELHKFLFDGLPVRGIIVRLTDTWTEILTRRESNTATGPWPPAVAELMGQMAAAGALMQSNIKFNGSLIMQIFGDGPVKLAVVEVKSDLGLRATAKVTGALASDASRAAPPAETNATQGTPVMGWSITPQLTTLDSTRASAWVVLTMARPFSVAR